MDEGFWSFSICTDAIDKCGMVALDGNLASRFSLRNRAASLVDVASTGIFVLMSRSSAGLGSEIQFLGFTLDCSINLWSNPDIAFDHRLEKINIEN